jgi:hypothetical protein
VSGFPVPAKAVEAGARAVYLGSAEEQVDIAVDVIAAAMPVLAEDPDLIERMMDQLAEASSAWPDEDREQFRGQASFALAVLFGGVVAHPEPEETMPDA